MTEMERRFSDDVGKVASVQEVLRDKPETADFSDISRIFSLPEEELKYIKRVGRYTRLSIDEAVLVTLLKNTHLKHEGESSMSYLSHSGANVPRSESSRERKFQGAKVPGSESSRERKFQGTKVPGSESSREQKFHVTFAPGSESSRERKFQGAKVPGSESSTYGTFALGSESTWKRKFHNSRRQRFYNLSHAMHR